MYMQTNNPTMEDVKSAIENLGKRLAHKSQSEPFTPIDLKGRGWEGSLKFSSDGKIICGDFHAVPINH